MAKDCTDDFLVEEEEPASAAIHLQGKAPKNGRAPQRPTPGHEQSQAPAKGPFAPAPPLEADCVPLDPHRLAQRQKQVDMGKNTLGYQHYLKVKPKAQRTIRDPMTPDINLPGSKRRFDGQIRVWRKEMHRYDQEAAAGQAGGASRATASGNKASGGGGAGDSSKAVDMEDEEEQEEGEVDERGDDSGGEESKGSLDGYFMPSRTQAGRKRTLAQAAAAGAMAAAAAAAADGTAAPTAPTDPANDGPQPKRSTASYSMGDNSLSALMSTCSNPAPAPGDLRGSAGAITSHGARSGGPTTFEGLGLAARVGGATNLLSKPPPTAPLAATAPAAPVAPGAAALDPYDNIVKMILGPDAASNMSWASDN